MLLCEVENPVRAQTMFSVDRISRQGDRFLGPLRMDAETLQSLRQDNVGLLFEKFLSLETMLGRIKPFADKFDFGRIAIVYSSATAGAHLHKLLCEDGLCGHQKKPPVTWEVGSLVFTSVENLAHLARQPNGTSISTVVLLDSSCMVSPARTLKLSNGRTHDRPQILIRSETKLLVFAEAATAFYRTGRKPTVLAERGFSIAAFTGLRAAALGSQLFVLLLVVLAIARSPSS